MGLGREEFLHGVAVVVADAFEGVGGHRVGEGEGGLDLVLGDVHGGGGNVGLADLIRPAESVEDQGVADDAQQAEAFALVEGEFGDRDAAGAAEGLAQEDVRPCRDGVRGCQVVGAGPEGGGVDGGCGDEADDLDRLGGGQGRASSSASLTGIVPVDVS